MLINLWQSIITYFSEIDLANGMRLIDEKNGGGIRQGRGNRAMSLVMQPRV